jgi:hypothetical protein
LYASVDLARFSGQDPRSGRQHTVDPFQGAIHALSIALATPTLQSLLAATESRPKLVAIDQHATTTQNIA